jgi:hypothetical protein
MFALGGCERQARLKAWVSVVESLGSFGGELDALQAAIALKNPMKHIRRIMIILP